MKELDERLFQKPTFTCTIISMKDEPMTYQSFYNSILMKHKWHGNLNLIVNNYIKTLNTNKYKIEFTAIIMSYLDTNNQCYGDFKNIIRDTIYYTGKKSIYLF